MLLQSWVGKLLHSIVGAVPGIINGARDVLYVAIDLLLFSRRRVRTRTNEVY